MNPEQLHVSKSCEWRKWLEKHHQTEKEVWLIFYKRHTSKPSISYDDAVEEALCFGWIDNIIKRIDDEKFARKFTPRKSESRWSELNKKRAQKMMKKKKMTDAGITKVEEAKGSGEWFKPPPSRKELKIPPFIEEELAKNKSALDNFNNLAKSYRRQYIGWIVSAKKEETRMRRLEEAIKLLARNEKLGMK